MKLGYFPGCSLHGSGKELSESLAAVAPALGVELEEVRDWACCGASSAHALNPLLAAALPARTLALAEKQGLDRVMAPCAACYNRLSGARHHIAKDPAFGARVGAAIEMPFRNSVGVLSIVEMLKALLPAIEEKRTRPLAGLKLACYYGCLLVRPADVTGFDDVEQPTSMEAIVSATGATPVAWNRKLDCCGGGFSLSRTGSVIRLGRTILDDARAAGADAIVTACPMCQSNLDFRQAAMRSAGEMPILYLTQVVGLALGLSDESLGLGRHFVNPARVLEGVR